MSAPHDIPDWFAFVAWFEGQGTAAEYADIERWIQSDPSHAAMGRRMRELWESRRRRNATVADAAEAVVAVGEVAGIDRVMASIRTAPGVARPILVRERETTGGPILAEGVKRFGAHRPVREVAGMAGGASVKRLFGVWPRRGPGRHALFRTAGFGVAAGAAILLVGASFALQRYSHARIDTPTVAREFTTRRGERAVFDLADGTHVVLAPESRLRIPANYHVIAGFGMRDVELDGEAYFEVTHDAQRPFRVRTTIGVAEDIGTAFVVTSYADTRGMRVMVASGEVALHHTMLHRGDLAWLDTAGTVTVRQHVSVDRRLAWTSGRIAFDGTPLRDALATLSRWFDVEARLADPSFALHPITATFDRTATARDIARVLALSLEMRADWQGRIVTFHTVPPSP